ncbi:MAG: hypothetical protein EOP68_26510 [Sphingomonas sp.]|nr:MAG: hypothetical protein EOP68_26510 [Sphingomonas sp.]
MSPAIRVAGLPSCVWCHAVPVRLSRSLFGDALVLGGQTQVAPGGESDSVDFPVRHQLTASYRIRPGIRLIGGYEIADGADFVAHTSRIGVDVAPWTGAKVMTTINQQAASETGGENAERTYAQYGLSQSVPLGRHWTVDATLDSSRTVKGAVPAGAVISAFQPIASGGSIADRVGRVDRAGRRAADRRLYRGDDRRRVPRRSLVVERAARISRRRCGASLGDHVERAARAGRGQDARLGGARL